MDSLLAIAQMPPGVPVACMAVNGARNAAVFAARILALKHDKIGQALEGYRERLQEA
jgi:5-(carboxyamino)imidazole ribonucleotide mutase